MKVKEFYLNSEYFGSTPSEVIKIHREKHRDDIENVGEGKYGEDIFWKIFKGHENYYMWLYIKHLVLRFVWDQSIWIYDQGNYPDTAIYGENIEDIANKIDKLLSYKIN